MFVSKPRYCSSIARSTAAARRTGASASVCPSPVVGGSCATGTASTAVISAAPDRRSARTLGDRAASLRNEGATMTSYIAHWAPRFVQNLLLPQPPVGHITERNMRINKLVAALGIAVLA